MALNPIMPAGRLAPSLFHKTRMEYQPHLRHYHHYYPNVLFFVLGVHKPSIRKKPPSLRLVTSIAVFAVFCLSLILKLFISDINEWTVHMCVYVFVYIYINIYIN